MTIEELRDELEARLGVTFRARYSDDIGSYFKASGVGSENFSIQPNYEDDRDEDHVQEPAFADHAVLLYVNRTERGDEVRDALSDISGLEFLRRDTLE
jgi:nuclear transport factor 2 (NTF2) superfamily protein